MIMIIVHPFFRRGLIRKATLNRDSVTCFEKNVIRLFCLLFLLTMTESESM